jgi:LysM domain
VNRLSRWRIIIFTSLTAVMILTLCSCQTITDLKSDMDQNAAMKRLKRGQIKDGVYSNEFYEFEFHLPKEWRCKVGDPPSLVVGNPPSQAIPDASARKFIDIQALVLTRQEGDDLQKAITRYSGTNNYDFPSQSPGFIAKAESSLCVGSGYWNKSPVRIIALVILTQKEIIIIQCRALRPLYDNVEAQFRYSVGTVNITTKPLKPIEPTPAVNQYNPSRNTFFYTTRKGDTGAQIAKHFMGSESRAWLIIQLNDIKEFKEDLRLEIPQVVPYKIRRNDTWRTISQNVSGMPRYASWIQKFNENTRLEAGKTINVPLFTETDIAGWKGYVDVAKQVYKKVELADFLMIYNGNRPMSELEKIKLPIFLLDQFYSYRVQQGDTLATISAWLTGDSKNYRLIAEANNLPSPYVLALGQVLKIPVNLVSDPSVLDKPRPKPKKPKKKPKPKKRSTPKPKKPSRTPTPVPSPQDNIDLEGIYEPG